ncbi:MAG: hypothetical protein WA947_05880 [Phormidesmis sp.]
MTYTTPEDLSSMTSEQVPSTFDKAKVLYQEGSTRSVRVAKILKAAFSQTAAEFKEGRQSLSPLAQEVTSETVATVKEKGQKAAEVLNDAWVQEADSQDLTERISRFLSVIAQSASQSAKTRLFPQMKVQASKLDGLLKGRYGDRYESIRAKFEVVRSWYAAPAQSATSPYEADSADDEITAIEVDSEVIR